MRISLQQRFGVGRFEVRNKHESEIEDSWIIHPGEADVISMINQYCLRNPNKIMRADVSNTGNESAVYHSINCTLSLNRCFNSLMNFRIMNNNPDERDKTYAILEEILG